MRLCGQVQTVEEHNHHPRDALSVQIRRRPTGEQQQRPRSGETDTWPIVTSAGECMCRGQSRNPDHPAVVAAGAPHDARQQQYSPVPANAGLRDRASSATSSRQVENEDGLLRAEPRFLCQQHRSVTKQPKPTGSFSLQMAQFSSSGQLPCWILHRGRPIITGPDTYVTLY